MEMSVPDLAEFTEDTVSIDPLDLNREFVELAPRLAYWNAQLAEATRKSMLAKIEHDRARAGKLVELRETLRSGTDPRLAKATVDEIDARVTLDDDVADAQIVYVRLEGERLRIKGIVDAILCKRDMLQSLGAKLRAEMAGDPVLRSQLAARTGLEAEQAGR